MRLARVKDKPNMTTGMEKAKKSCFTIFTFESFSNTFFNDWWVNFLKWKIQNLSICITHFYERPGK